MPFVLEEMGHRRLLFTGNIPRGVFCEWSAAEVTENPRIAPRNVLLGTECTVTIGVTFKRLLAWPLT